MMEKVELFVNDDFIQCSVDLVRFRVTVNSVHGMFLTAALEVFNAFIGKDNLFVRSLILIKLWVHKEAKRFSFLGTIKYNNLFLQIINITSFILQICPIYFDTIL